MAEQLVTRLILSLPAGDHLALNVAGPSITISPDGRYIAYLAGKDETSLYLRAMDQLEARRVEGSQKASTPVFSPDSKWVGFAKDLALLRVAVSGGAPEQLFATAGTPRGLDWSDQGFVFSGEVSTGLLRSDRGRPEPKVLTVLDRERREKTHRFPQILPGGDAVLFTLATSTTDSYDDASIAVMSMKTGEYRIVLEGGSSARYSSTGHLLYARRGALHAVPFDLKELEVTAQPVVVLDGLLTSPVNGGAEFDVSDSGTLVYAPGRSRTDDRTLTWIDRQGQAQMLVEAPRPFNAVRLSPDGRRVVMQVFGCIDSIWMYEIERGTLTRVTSEWDNAAPIWDPLGREIVFSSARASAYNLYKLSIDGGGAAERLATSDYTQVATSWSSDGSVLVFHETRTETGLDIFSLSLSGDRTPRPFLTGRASEGWAALSPNGRWIAYQSNESGRYEIYVQRFPDGGSLRQVSTDGGEYPAWSANAKELFYRNGHQLVAVDVTNMEGELVLGRPEILYERQHGRTFFNTFGVTPDGQKFLDLDASVAEPAPEHLVLVQNFAEELKKLAPAGK